MEVAYIIAGLIGLAGVIYTAIMQSFLKRDLKQLEFSSNKQMKLIEVALSKDKDRVVKLQGINEALLAIENEMQKKIYTVLKTTSCIDEKGFKKPIDQIKYLMDCTADLTKIQQELIMYLSSQKDILSLHEMAKKTNDGSLKLLEKTLHCEERERELFKLSNDLFSLNDDLGEIVVKMKIIVSQEIQKYLNTTECN